ncbi:cytochrome b/b6 domain-containing protein [Shewanella cyperi]|uniref:cytochrome b/b6 domain-containing protein n=1 Tax=Shewanella cyperi TaxID=2814292 RepID=UPI001A94936C|nr:cytochrome b/b6 domain-containing protein [Shewanella cyperi]QSX41620.1 cytochrome b/b6 domain-containing protein [Shewanella cyperi]
MHTQSHIKVWDLPVRLFHWSMVILLGLLWWSAEAGEMAWHQVFGFTLMVLLLFRILWGLVGSDTARFARFVHHPLKVLAYARSVRREGVKAHVGHNPLGAYMVVTLLSLLLLQLGTGLFATDEIFTEGPLVSYVSSDVASALTWLHKFNFNLLLLLATVHVLAVIWHLLNGDRLLGAMFTGKKPHIGENVAVRFAPLRRALLIVTVLGYLIGNFLIWPVLQSM